MRHDKGWDAYIDCRTCGARILERRARGGILCHSCFLQYGDPITRPGAWIDQAVCATTDPELFFNDKNQFSYQRAIQICSTCPVINECLDYAVACNIRDGIWGGLTPAQRRHLTRARA